MIKTIQRRGGNVKLLMNNPNEHIQSFWNKDKFYEEAMLNYIRKNYTKGVFLDVGANIGNHTLFVAAFCNPKKILSFEPVPDFFEHLRENIKINKLKNVTALNVALGSKKENKKIFIFDRERNIGAAKIGDNGTINITVDSLDSIVNDLKLTQIDLIKIDVEGYNLNVLEGAKKTIVKFKPDLLIECESRCEKKKVTNCLKKYRYTINRSIVFNLTPTYLFTHKTIQKNSIIHPLVLLRENFLFFAGFFRRKILKKF